MKLPVVGITMGDPVGIGPEIITKALSDPRVLECCRPVVYGDAGCLNSAAATTGTPPQFVNVRAVADATEKGIAFKAINPADRPSSDRIEWGAPTTASAAAMRAYLNAAIDDAMAGHIAAIATGPINKRALKMTGSHHSGHTEILARRTGITDYAMMLAGERLKVVLATIHIALERVPKALNSAEIARIVALTDHSLKTRFGLPRPRIAVAGLNPHAGEEGLFGDEEQAIIAPAIDGAVSRGIDVSGPHPPDTIFYTASTGAYDAVIAMYHDQGLGPFKMIHFDDGVNTTLGLPIIRTSVDHGTAYDIAGTGQASAESMVAAIQMAANQARYLAIPGRVTSQPEPA